MKTQRPNRPQILAKWCVNSTGYSVVEASLGNAVELRHHYQPSGLLYVSPEFSALEQAVELDLRRPAQWIVLNGPTDWGRPESWEEVGKLGFESYDPLRVPGLHRAFAASGSSAESLLSFVEQYGLLGNQTYRVQLPEGQVSWGETVLSLTEQSNQLRFLLDVWDLLRMDGPSDSLERYIHLLWHPEAILDIFLPEYEPMNSLGGPVPFESIPGNDSDSQLRAAAKACLREAVLEALSETTSPFFEIGSGGQISLAPKNLLGAIYVHFLQELLGRSDPLFRCASCGKWFIQRHAGRIYCGQACKQKAYRRGLTKQKVSDGN